MKTMIAVPCLDQVSAQFAQSLACLNRVGDSVIAMQMGSLIYNSRNDLAKKAFQLGADYVLWLDSDMVFPSDTLERLYEGRDKGDIITGVYYRRVEPYKPVLMDKLEITEKGCEYCDVEMVPEENFEVEGCGFGCVFMPTKILLDVALNYGNIFAPINGVGEDLSFCWRARQLGYKIVCDPSIPLGHVGHYMVTKDFYEAYSIAKGK